MRGKDGYGSVIQVIEALHKQVPLSVMFTLSPYNDFDDMAHVAGVCKRYDIDLRVGVYNDIAFFDTIDKAHQTDVAEKKTEETLTYKQLRPVKQRILDKNRVLKKSETKHLSQPKHEVGRYQDMASQIPSEVDDFPENKDFLLLYDAWRQKKLRLRCHSILDSLIVLPDGTVPVCQNLSTPLGNVYEKSLDHIFNGAEAQKVQRQHVRHCNQCWINFHRKYDVVLYRTFERFFGPWATSKLLGSYHWHDEIPTYDSLMRQQSLSPTSVSVS